MGCPAPSKVTFYDSAKDTTPSATTQLIRADVPGPDGAANADLSLVRMEPRDILGILDVASRIDVTYWNDIVPTAATQVGYPVVLKSNNWKPCYAVKWF